jgi:hypothetical protein
MKHSGVYVFKWNAQHIGPTCTNILNYNYFSIRIQNAHSAICFMNFAKILTFSYTLHCKLNDLPDKLRTNTTSQFKICCLRDSCERRFTLDIPWYQRKRQIKITISELNFIIINIKVNDNYFNAGTIQLAVLLNSRDIRNYKNSNDFNTTQNSCR